jgi:hypothetical protein
MRRIWYISKMDEDVSDMTYVSIEGNVALNDERNALHRPMASTSIISTSDMVLTYSSLQLSSAVVLGLGRVDIVVAECHKVLTLCALLQQSLPQPQTYQHIP